MVWDVIHRVPSGCVAENYLGILHLKAVDQNFVFRSKQYGRAHYVSRTRRPTGFQEVAGSILGPATYLS